MADSRPSGLWRFGLFERFVLAAIILALGVLQGAQLFYLLDQAGATTAQMVLVKRTMGIGLLVSTFVLVAGGPAVRSALHKVAPRVREAVGY